MNPDADKGRVVKLEPVALKHWGELKQGTLILLPTATGETLEGVVNLVMEDNGWVRIGGALFNKKGSFTLNTSADQVNGRILLPSEEIGYEIVMDGTEVLLIERRLSSLICSPGIETSPTQGNAAATMPNTTSGWKVGGKPVLSANVSEATRPCIVSGKKTAQSDLGSRPDLGNQRHSQFKGEV